MKTPEPGRRPGLAQRLEAQWWRPGAGALSNLLLPLAWLYRGLLALPRAPAQRLDVPVLVVGNLIVGGAGKTPTTLAVVQLLKQAGWHPGIVSRGWGRERDEVEAVAAGSTPRQVGDEPLLLQRRSQVPVVVGRDRVAAGRALRRRHPEVNVIVCDDGLQHRRLHADLAVVVWDTRGAGNGRLLPAGPLREPMPAAPKAHWLVLYNAAAPSTPWPGFLATRALAGAVELGAWQRGESGSLDALHRLRGRAVLAAAGMAEPERFFTMLEAEGLQLQRLPLPDHHAYATLPWPAGTREVIVTEKDAVKLDPQRLGATRVWVAALDFAPDPAFGRELLRRLQAC